MRNIGLQGGIKAAIESKEEPGEDDKPIDNSTRAEWNKYVNFLEKKGYKGHPDLDKNDLGGKMIDEYRKENPSSPISRESIIPIQKEFSKYRDWSLEQIKNGKGQFAEGVTPENYMKSLSVVDGVAGSRTTNFRFPNEYMQQFENGKKKGMVNKGFAVMK